MRTQRRTAAADPFAMLLDPQATMAIIERAERREGIVRHVCRPLDKPLIPKRDGDGPQDFDHEIDGEPDTGDAG